MSFLGINLASRALQAVQRELEITGQNIANASTPGYSRQVGVTVPIQGPGMEGGNTAAGVLAPGGGMDIQQVLRTHASWLDRATEGLEAQSGQGAVEMQYSSKIESLLFEPSDSGLQSVLGRFFSAFSNLSANPSDLALRDAVVRAGQDVGQQFQELTDGISDLTKTVMTQA